MQGDSFIQTCPRCGKSGRTTKKWVKNQSGKRYNYVVFHHGTIAHWVNQDLPRVGEVYKNEVQQQILRLLNSIVFRPAVFTVNDLAAALDQTGLHLTRDQVRKSVSKLASRNILILIKNGKRVSYINGTHLDRLYYIVKGIDISLQDTNGDCSFERHEFKLEILNDNEFPLQYIQFKAVGDVPRDKEQVSFRAYDISNRENANIYYLEDEPLRKRMIIKFVTPILRNQSRRLILQYSWPITSFFHSFTAPTLLKSLKFTLISKNSLKLEVLRTRSERTEVEDESEQVSIKTLKNGALIHRFETKNMPPFVMFIFKWKREGYEASLEANVSEPEEG
ncbi:MAG: hypothetical protein M1290_05205 [Candidatus Thermoplasmatota archaeon]|nr:hypothetical protein [Candidatus Thermoplasmatota archaeon]MCL5789842.1 hypothetical protein [Candidatus Thermoplasmatota archaeon]